MAKLLSTFVGVLMLGLASLASAAEPVTLSEAQMDSVIAGQTTNNNGNVVGLVNAALLGGIIAGVISNQ